MINKKENIIPYRQYILTLAGLIGLTLISIILAQIYPSAFTAVIILLIAAVNSYMILRFFMHLRFQNRMLNIMLICIILLISLIIIITLSGSFY